MRHLSRTAFLRAAVDDWQARGVLPADQADALRADIGPEAAGRGFMGFVVIAGVVSLMFGAMTFVAANWEEMSRLARVLLIFAALWASWGGVLYARMTGRTWLSAVLTLLACGLFGAGIMLISQMYHIQGNPRDAVWLWMLGTLAAAALAWSPMALALAFGLMALWHLLGVFDDLAPVNWLFLVPWLAGAALCLAMRSRIVAHMGALALCAWALSEIIVEDLPEALFMVTTAAGFAVLALLLASHARPRLLQGFEPEAVGYVLALTGLSLLPLYLVPDEATLATGRAAVLGWSALAASLVLCIGLAVMGQARGWRTEYDQWVTVGALVLTALAFFVLRWPGTTDLVLLALSIWCVRIGHRLDSTLLRVLGAVWFAGMMLTIYAKTLGDLLGTSLFYLGAGALLLAGAFIATRLGRRREGKA
ncbi:DUF2157 domain-containing protein [Pseudaestuariivita atlantica]|uniref:DUF2157 domain-containing protein n=1 Tax=Pseudaestuariivita atlantica TaxID=1317121 RepID=A0A0L1JSH6_9RHOB|nr:DUF2157 domain-containing protein [Pseudaestuariivita atlantica]KNG94348.1 hypothetical protein ATO11_09145 [Pseudaestuariivita atlantica]